MHRGEGFSLVEVVVAMLILGLIAIALIPPLINGLRYSVEQSVVATSTRHLNALIEEMRDNPDCARTSGTPGDVPLVPNATAFSPVNASLNGVYFEDGKGSPLTVEAFEGPPASPSDPPDYVCAEGGLMDVYLRAVDASGDVVATVTAKIYMGG